MLVVLTYSWLTLAFKKYQRRAAWYLRTGWDASVCALLFLFFFLSEPLICCFSEEAVSMATAPSSHSSVSRWGEFTLGWWAQWVITFCNENDWEIAKRSEAETERKGESPVRRDKRTNRRALKRDWMRAVESRMSHPFTKACVKKRTREEWRNRDCCYRWHADDNDYDYFGDEVDNPPAQQVSQRSGGPSIHLVDKGQRLITSPPDSCAAAHQSAKLHH